MLHGHIFSYPWCFVLAWTNRLCHRVFPAFLLFRIAWTQKIYFLSPSIRPLLEDSRWALPGRSISPRVLHSTPSLALRSRLPLNHSVRRHFSGSRRNPARGGVSLHSASLLREVTGYMMDLSFAECRECRHRDRKRVWDEEGGEWEVIGFAVTYVAWGGWAEADSSGATYRSYKSAPYFCCMSHRAGCVQPVRVWTIRGFAVKPAAHAVHTTPPVKLWVSATNASVVIVV